jgi:hypothetical protein
MGQMRGKTRLCAPLRHHRITGSVITALAAQGRVAGAPAAGRLPGHYRRIGRPGTWYKNSWTWYKNSWTWYKYFPIWYKNSWTWYKYFPIWYKNSWTWYKNSRRNRQGRHAVLLRFTAQKGCFRGLKSWYKNGTRIRQKQHENKQKSMKHGRQKRAYGKSHKPLIINGTRGGIRTRTRFRATDFKSVVYAIPPLGRLKQVFNVFQA